MRIVPGCGQLEADWEEVDHPTSLSAGPFDCLSAKNPSHRGSIELAHDLPYPSGVESDWVVSATGFFKGAKDTDGKEILHEPDTEQTVTVHSSGIFDIEFSIESKGGDTTRTLKGCGRAKYGDGPEPGWYVNDEDPDATSTGDSTITEDTVKMLLVRNEPGGETRTVQCCEGTKEAANPKAISDISCEKAEPSEYRLVLFSRFLQFSFAYANL